MISTFDHIHLKKGQYLAPDYQVTDFEEVSVGITNYNTVTETGVWHSHEKPMISFVLYGNNTEFRKGNSTKRVAGSVNFYHSHEPHRNVYNCFPSKHISLELDPQFLERYGYIEADIDLAVKKGHEPIFTFIKVMSEALLNDMQSKDVIEMLFVAFVENSLNSKKEDLLPHWAISVRELLNDRWNENISLQELATNVGVHPTTISKHFRKYFQCTMGEYTRKLKVKKAIDLLHTSKHSLTEIAYICGFSDQSHFIRIFKSMTGYLPRTYLKL